MPCLQVLRGTTSTGAEHVLRAGEHAGDRRARIEHGQQQVGAALVADAGLGGREAARPARPASRAARRREGRTGAALAMAALAMAACSSEQIGPLRSSGPMRRAVELTASLPAAAGAARSRASASTALDRSYSICALPLKSASTYSACALLPWCDHGLRTPRARISSPPRRRAARCWRRSSTLTMCQPNWSCTGSLTSPFFSLKAAASNSGTICPRPKKPSSPPWSLEPGSLEFSLASCAKSAPCGDLLVQLPRLLLAVDQDVAGAHLLLGLQLRDLAVVDLLGLGIADRALDASCRSRARAGRGGASTACARSKLRACAQLWPPRRRRRTAGCRSGTPPARGASTSGGRVPRSLPISASASFMSDSVIGLAVDLGDDACRCGSSSAAARRQEAAGEDGGNSGGGKRGRALFGRRSALSGL